VGVVLQTTHALAHRSSCRCCCGASWLPCIHAYGTWYSIATYARNDSCPNWQLSTWGMLRCCCRRHGAEPDCYYSYLVLCWGRCHRPHDGNGTEMDALWWWFFPGRAVQWRLGTKLHVVCIVSCDTGLGSQHTLCLVAYQTWHGPVRCTHELGHS